MNLRIGERIATRRKELGITGRQIKEATGISTGNLSGIENGSSLPSAAALISLSKILNCSIDWILTGETPILEHQNQSTLSESQKELLETYNRLDRRGQHRVHTIIYEELDRMNAEIAEEISVSKSII